MLKFRTLIIAIFALAGAIVFVATVPNLLDFMFDSIKASTTGTKNPGFEAAQLEQRTFRKLSFTDESIGKSSLQDLKSGRKTLDELAKEQKLALVDVQLSTNALLRTDLSQIARLKSPGEYALVFDDPEKGSASIYEYKSKTTTPKGEPVDEAPKGYPGSRQPLIILALAMLGAMFGGGFGNIALRTSKAVTNRWEEMETGDRVNLFLGTVVGIIGSLPFLIALGNLGPIVASLLTLGLTLGFSAFSVYALNSMEEVLPWKKGEVRGRRSGTKVLDTNVLIDGRIYDLARTGFLEGEIYVPKFVLQELQHIADSADPLRRQRGRRGLEVLKHLQTEHPVEIGTHDRFASDEHEEVDSRLVKLAMALGADLVSNDYNLNRVASIQKVRVLNINDLALSLRPNILPGEVLEITINKEGSQPGQGVGYLDDGTMIVVENGRPHIGEHIEITVTQVIQTERGKMIFGAYGDDDGRKPNGNRR